MKRSRFTEPQIELILKQSNDGPSDIACRPPKGARCQPGRSGSAATPPAQAGIGGKLQLNYTTGPVIVGSPTYDLTINPHTRQSSIYKEY